MSRPRRRPRPSAEARRWQDGPIGQQNGSEVVPDSSTRLRGDQPASLTLTIPGVKLPSPNVGSHASRNWRAGWGAAKRVKTVVGWQMRAALSPPHARALLDSGCVVKLVRLSTRELDDDNLVGSGKHARDAIAAVFGCDDRDPRISWAYAQERAAGYGVRIEIRPRPRRSR